MCDFCEKEEEISKSPEILEGKHTAVSIKVDEETKLFKLRMEIGSFGYTLPIKINYCMFCGKEINIHFKDDMQ